MRRRLIVIDMQNDFVYGCLGSVEAMNIVENVKNKISEYVSSGDEIIFTRDTHHKNYLDTQEGRHLPIPHCIYGTDGWKIVDGLEVPNCKYINKNSFGWMDWDLYGGVINKIEIVGVCTDICVISNALILKSMFPEVEIKVDSSCCAGTTPEKHEAALAVMKSCQIYVL